MTFLLAARYIHNTRADDRPATADVFGATTVTSGLLVLVYDIVKAQQYGWTSARTLGLFVVAAALLVTFVIVERRSKAPLIRLDIFRVRSLVMARTWPMLFVMSGLAFSMFYFCVALRAGRSSAGSPLKAGAGIPAGDRRRA